MARLDKAATKITKRSRAVSPSPKQSKRSDTVFGSSSQFKGVGRGVPGDPRK